MAPRSAPRSIRRRTSFYSAEALEELVEAAGGLPDDEIEAGTVQDWAGTRSVVRQSRRDVLHERLDRAAASYLFSTKAARRPSQAAQAAQYEAVQAKLREALTAVLPPPGEIRDRLHGALQFGLSSTDVRHAILQLAKLYRAARASRL